MQRKQMLHQLDEHADNVWDIVVIGGGATGLGIAVDAAARGHKILLLEQADFAKGTSSKSTKLVHGGVRYLAQGDVSLVLEALRERGLLRQNAPHLVHNQAFIIPNYKWWDGPFYTLGMKVYDRMAGDLGLGPSVAIEKEEALKAIPNLDPHGLVGGVIYYDGQFDDARLAMNLVTTAAEQGATLLNYARVTGLHKSNSGMVTGLVAHDHVGKRDFTVQANVVINATGVFVDDIVQMDRPGARKLVTPSQGVHIVLHKEFLKGDAAIMIPKTNDGRVLFAVPWHNRVIVGTTDTPVDQASLEPKPLREEIDFILATASQYLAKDPTRDDILSIFAGLRPLAAPKEKGGSTKEISRGHRIIVAPSGLITIVGGKWTTYRKMAEDVVDRAQMILGLTNIACPTESLPIHGAKDHDASPPSFAVYGGDGVHIAQLAREQPELNAKIHPDLPYTLAEIVWLCRHEMPVHLEDMLARRTRAILLDARASLQAATLVAQTMAKELGHDAAWVKNEVTSYTALVNGYLPVFDEFNEVNTQT